MREEIVEMVTIASATLTTNREGQEAWKTMVEIPSFHSKYPVGPLWVPVTQGAYLKQGDQARVKLRRGRQKSGSAGTNDWDYFWECEQWGTEEAPTEAPAPPSEPRSGNSQDEFRRSKEQMNWIEALNNATHLVAALLRMPDADVHGWHNTAGVQAEILGWASWFFDTILAGPPVAAGEPEPAPVPPVAPDPPPQQARAGTRKAADAPAGPDPVPSALVALNEARKAAGVSVQRLKGEAHARYGTNDIRTLDARRIDELTASLVNGDLGPG